MQTIFGYRIDETYSIMVEKEKEEAELIREILIGNSRAMKELYNNYSGYLTTVCSRYIADNDDVKDVLQESFIKIYKSMKDFQYRGLGSLKAWTSRIVVNECLKFLKKREKLQIINKPTWELPDVNEEESDFDDIPTSKILEMIRLLPQGYRTVFNLYIFEKKSHKEIASILKITENTSASQLHRAKNFLAKEINAYRSVKEWSYE